MGCSVGKSEDVAVNSGERTSRRVSASGAESMGEAEKASSASTLSSQLADAITLIHFNDVYNIEEREKEPCGGAPRFKTQVDSLRELDPLIVFSGDALNPSNSKYHLLSELFLPCLNLCVGVTCNLILCNTWNFYVTPLLYMYCVCMCMQSAS